MGGEDLYYGPAIVIHFVLSEFLRGVNTAQLHPTVLISRRQVLDGSSKAIRDCPLRNRVLVTESGDMFTISPGEFEELVGVLLERMGYSEVRRVGGAGDLNVDLWCRDTNQRLVAVQCKRYFAGQSIGSPAIQTFIGMIYRHHGAGRGIFVTTPRFTRDADALAASNNIMLIDGEQLTGLLRRF